MFVHVSVATLTLRRLRVIRMAEGREWPNACLPLKAKPSLHPSAKPWQLPEMLFTEYMRGQSKFSVLVL